MKNVPKLSRNINVMYSGIKMNEHEYISRYNKINACKQLFGDVDELTFYKNLIFHENFSCNRKLVQLTSFLVLEMQ